jgi:3-polyprenyl-4-hydroxybenzoate decarboxylase
MSEKAFADPKSDLTSQFRTQDLRDWLAAAEELGQLKHVKGAHWDLELGAITEINNRRRGPCLLTKEIADYPSG